jgi:protein subunit release factor B
MPINTLEYLYYNPINKVDPEFNEYKKQQRKKEGLGNRIDKYNFTYNKIETKEEKEMRKREKEKKRKEKEFMKKKLKYIFLIIHIINIIIYIFIYI